jgi:hypothetical protein
VGPKVVVVERRESRSGVTNETASSVGVHAEQERNEEVVSVPKRFERLLSNPVVRSCVDQQHAEKHNMSSNSTSFGVVNLESDLRTDLSALNVEEAGFISPVQHGKSDGCLLDVMSTCVQDGKEKHGVCDLFVEPLVLVERRPSSLWSKPSEDVSAHGHNDNHSVDRQNQTSTSRYPHGELESIKWR